MNLWHHLILVFVRSNIFRKGARQYRRSIVLHLPYQTNSTIDIVHYAVEALRKIFRTGIVYKKAGVMVMDISPQQIYQTSLFSRRDPRHDILMEAIDKINYTIGTDKIKLASQDQGRTWKMKQEHLSRRYTTRLDEIIDVY